MKKLLLPFVTLAFCFFTQVSFAQKYYMKAGQLTRDASLAGPFQDYTEISSRQFSVTAGAGQKPGNVSFQEMVITKLSDLSSNKLLATMTKPTRIDEVEIVATTASHGDGTRVVTNKIQLRNPVIVSYATSAANGCESGCTQIAESYKLTYEAIKITTYSQNDKTGEWTADPSPFMYNLKTATNTY
ncbi:type VI secretion system tube protein Hcp [Dyadobacter luticola]|uniref:Type VI secretion system tube protein Hcp n=1 Tax=Dyadobacter luticola TaxID=1979387 RepID=A0A5R9KVK9_9BACT|nr:type VI secretion system tube protein Hcp [Dyadobacter luticola]TLV00303.1 type VI secretion system tube protein Hcp [Dyadobacter luticola]